MSRRGWRWAIAGRISCIRCEGVAKCEESSWLGVMITFRMSINARYIRMFEAIYIIST